MIPRLRRSTIFALCASLLILLWSPSHSAASSSPRRVVSSFVQKRLTGSRRASVPETRHGRRRQRETLSTTAKATRPSGTKPLPEQPQSTKTTLLVLYAITLVNMMLNSMVALYPAQALIQQWGAKYTTTALSIVAALGATIEIAGAGLVSRWLKRPEHSSRRGKRALLIATAIPATINSVLSLLLLKDQTRLPATMIVASRGLGLLCLALFFLTSQTIMVTEPFLSRFPAAMASAMGTQMGIIGIGFLIGMVLAGRLSDPVLLYKVASVTGLCVVVLIAIFMPTAPRSAGMMDRTERVPTPTKAKRNPWRPSGKTVLFMLMTIQIFMGDFFLVFVKSQWNLDAAQISTLLVLFGVTNSVANMVVGRLMLPRLGVRRTTAIAIAGKLLQTAAIIVYGYHGAIATMILLFWSSAQNLGMVTTMDVQERTQATAILKILGPCIYSALYIQGQAWWGQAHLPFYFNMVLSVAALTMTFLYL